MSIIARRVLIKSTVSNPKISKPFLSSRYQRITTLNKYGNTLKQSSHIPSIISLSNRSNHGEPSDKDPRTKDYFNDYRANTASSTSLPASLNFDPSNTAQVFQSFSTFQLIKYNLMFSMLGIEPLTNTMIAIMKKVVGSGVPENKDKDQKNDNIQPNTSKTMTLNDIPGASAMMAILGMVGNVAAKPLIYLVRKQYFPLFTGGENIDECIRLARKYYDNNIRLIIDNSVEEGHTRDVYARNLDLKKQLIDVSSSKLPKSVLYMAIKMTALSSPTLLEQMTTILNTEKPSDRDPTPFMDDEQMNELEYTLSNLIEICQYSKDRGIGVWLDAEQFARQPAMNYLSRRLMQVINTEPNKVYLYNTYQCYLKDSHDWISFDIEHAKQNGYLCGIKLVRGAYMDYESGLAKEEGRPNPIHDDKTNADRSYNEAVNYVMEQIVESYGSVGIAVCTHNRGSLKNATEQMARLGIERDDPSVVTAQLNGMVDNLTYALGYTGYNALKLIPYGDFEDVWPFLMRRFEENSQILNGSQQERALYGIEIKRRVKAIIGM